MTTKKVSSPKIDSFMQDVRRNREAIEAPKKKKTGPLHSRRAGTCLGQTCLGQHRLGTRLREGGSKGGGLKGGPKVGWEGPKPGKNEGSKGGRPEILLFFFPLPPQFSFFLPSLGGLLVQFWWCFKRRESLMCTFGVLGAWCETPAAGKKREILGAPPFGPPPTLWPGEGSMQLKL